MYKLLRLTTRKNDVQGRPERRIAIGDHEQDVLDEPSRTPAGVAIVGKGCWNWPNGRLPRTGVHAPALPVRVLMVPSIELASPSTVSVLPSEAQMAHINFESAAPGARKIQHDAQLVEIGREVLAAQLSDCRFEFEEPMAFWGALNAIVSGARRTSSV
jgi:hypothetical protein